MKFLIMIFIFILSTILNYNCFERNRSNFEEKNLMLDVIGFFSRYELLSKGFKVPEDSQTNDTVKSFIKLSVFNNSKIQIFLPVRKIGSFVMYSPQRIETKYYRDPKIDVISVVEGFGNTDEVVVNPFQTLILYSHILSLSSFKDDLKISYPYIDNKREMLVKSGELTLKAK